MNKLSPGSNGCIDYNYEPFNHLELSRDLFENENQLNSVIGSSIEYHLSIASNESVFL